MYREPDPPALGPGPTWWASLTEKGRFCWVIGSHGFCVLNFLLLCWVANDWWTCLIWQQPYSLLAIGQEVRRSIQDFDRAKQGHDPRRYQPTPDYAVFGVHFVLISAEVLAIVLLAR